jgi:hypothetical protein
MAEPGETLRDGDRSVRAQLSAIHLMSANAASTSRLNWLVYSAAPTPSGQGALSPGRLPCLVRASSPRRDNNRLHRHRNHSMWLLHAGHRLESAGRIMLENKSQEDKELHIARLSMMVYMRNCRYE